MPDILSTSITGLLSYQSALQTTSHNIANVGNDTYSRQNVQLNARTPLRVGSDFIGQGVIVSDVRRLIDSYVTENIREFTSTTSRMEIFESLASRVESLVANDQGGLMPALDGFFNALNDVANDPAANAPRVALLGAAELLERQMNTIGDEMQELEQETDQRISFTLNEINALTSDVARLNDAIVRVSGVDAQPSDLLDQRDDVLRQLSERISLSVIEQSDGTLNVLMGSGQLLVTGTTALTLVARADAQQPDRLSVGLQSTGSTIDLSNTTIGGELGGLLDFRNNMLDTAQNRLGRLAIGLAETFNNQHIQGIDLDGNFGTNFFSTVDTGDLRGLIGGDYRANGFNDGDTIGFDLNFDGLTLNVAVPAIIAADTNQDIGQNILDQIAVAAGAAGATVTAIAGGYAITDTTTAGVTTNFTLRGDQIQFESAGGPYATGNTLAISNLTDGFADDAVFNTLLIGTNSTNVNSRLVATGGTATFAGPLSSALNNLNNAGTAEVYYSITDITALTVSDYSVEFDGTNYNVRRLSDAQIVATTSAPPSVPPFAMTNIDGVSTSIDGMDITITAGMVAGDSFYMRPTRNGALSFTRQIDDPKAIAAGTPVRSMASVNNIGDVKISAPTLTDVTHGDFLRTVDIFFDPTNPNATFDVIDRATGTVLQNDVIYTSGMTVSQNGWQIQITGAAENGDVLSVMQNTNAATDNTNMLVLAELQNQNFLDRNSATYQQAYSAMVSEIGTLNQQFKINLEVEQSLLANANLERQTLSGVNLDEEAANLIRFQQAYQAMTRVVQTAQAIFQSLLEAT